MSKFIALNAYIVTELLKFNVKHPFKVVRLNKQKIEKR